MQLLKSKSNSVVVHFDETLDEKEIDAELKALSLRQFRALIQLLEESRAEFATHAATAAELNNPLLMAKDNGAHEALSGLIIELNTRHSSAD